jgi:hypothetical protein
MLDTENYKKRWLKLWDKVKLFSVKKNITTREFARPLNACRGGAAGVDKGRGRIRLLHSPIILYFPPGTPVHTIFNYQFSFM